MISRTNVQDESCWINAKTYLKADDHGRRLSVSDRRNLADRA